MLINYIRLFLKAIVEYKYCRTMYRAYVLTSLGEKRRENVHRKISA